MREFDPFPLLQANWHKLIDFKAPKEAHSVYRARRPVPHPLDGKLQHLAREGDSVRGQPAIAFINDKTVQNFQTCYTIIDSHLFNKPVHDKLVAIPTASARTPSIAF